MSSWSTRSTSHTPVRRGGRSRPAGTQKANCGSSYSGQYSCPMTTSTTPTARSPVCGPVLGRTWRQAVRRNQPPDGQLPDSKLFADRCVQSGADDTFHNRARHSVVCADERFRCRRACTAGQLSRIVRCLRHAARRPWRASSSTATPPGRGRASQATTTCTGWCWSSMSDTDVLRSPLRWMRRLCPSGGVNEFGRRFPRRPASLKEGTHVRGEEDIACAAVAGRD